MKEQSVGSGEELMFCLLLARLDPDTIVRKGTKKGTKRGPHNGGPIYIYREKGTKRGTKKANQKEVQKRL